jgi:molecular chaperone GrpE
MALTQDEQTISQEPEMQEEGKPMQKTASKDEDTLSKLTEELTAEKEKSKELYERYLRLQAEFENFKKRMEREKCEYFKYALERLIKDLLPVFDHFEMAIKSSEGSKDFDSFSKGIQLIYKQLKDILAKEGLAYECSVGEKFDPCKHEAMMHIESGTHEPNVIVEEHKKGYFLNDRLIRPAMVTVAKKPEKKGPPETNDKNK